METFYKALEHAPALLAMVIIVIAFLKFLKEVMESHAKRTDEFIVTVKEIQRDNHEDREQSRDVIASNIRVTTENTLALADVARALRENSRGGQRQ